LFGISDDTVKMINNSGTSHLDLELLDKFGTLLRGRSQHTRSRSEAAGGPARDI
jgi:hypothetical protein